MRNFIVCLSVYLHNSQKHIFLTTSSSLQLLFSAKGFLHALHETFVHQVTELGKPIPSLPLTVAVLKVALHTGALAADYSASTNMSEEYADELLSKLADMLNSSSSEASAAADSTTVKRIVSMKNNKFDNNEQQDCHEFAQIGLDMLTEEHQSDAPDTGNGDGANTGNGSANTGNGNNCGVPLNNFSAHPVEKFFGIRVCAFLHCANCGCSKMCDSVNQISTILGLGDATAGSQALEAQDLLQSHFGTEESLPGYNCTSCNCKDVSTKVDLVTGR